MRSCSQPARRIPCDLVRRFDPTLRRLVGYGVYNGLIGHIDKRSPEQLLDAAGASHAMVWDRS